MSGEQVAEVAHVQAVHVFLRGDALDYHRLRKLRRQGQLHQDAMDGRIRIEPVDEREHSFERGIGGERMFFRADADLAAGL